MNQRMQSQAKTAKATLGQMLGQFQGMAMRAVAQSDNPVFGGQTEPLNFTNTSKTAIENTMEDGANSEAYDRITQRILAAKNVGKSPMDNIAMEVLKELKGGSIRVQPNIIMPELPEVKTKQEGDALAVVIDERSTANTSETIMIGGIELPVRLPKNIDPVIFDERGAVNPSGVREGEWDFMKPERQQAKDTQNDTTIIGSEAPSPEIKTSSEDVKTPSFMPDESDTQKHIAKVMDTAKKMADALAMQAAPSTGGQHDAQRQKDMQQAIRRTMMELNAHNDSHQEFTLAQDTSLITDDNLKLGRNPVNDATFKQMTNSIRSRLRGADKRGERGDEIIKQEVQKGFGQIRFGTTTQPHTTVSTSPEPTQPPNIEFGLKQTKQHMLGTTQKSRDEINRFVEDKQSDDLLSQVRQRKFKTRLF